MTFSLSIAFPPAPHCQQTGENEMSSASRMIQFFKRTKLLPLRQRLVGRRVLPIVARNLVLQLPPLVVASRHLRELRQSLHNGIHLRLDRFLADRNRHVCRRPAPVPGRVLAALSQARGHRRHRFPTPECAPVTMPWRFVYSPCRRHPSECKAPSSHPENFVRHLGPNRCDPLLR